jgi:phosphohistidine phosphatase
MKSILFVRHAKSGWTNPAIADFDRPLNERGLRDAPEMARRLMEKNITIDAFVSSTALRALTTAKLFQETFAADAGKLIEINDLYHAYPPMFFDVIKKLDDKLNTVAIFAHNPGITDMVNRMKVARVDDMPTCAVFGVRTDISHWKDFANAEKKFWFLDYPKM